MKTAKKVSREMAQEKGAVPLELGVFTALAQRMGLVNTGEEHGVS
jgi:hypothetical protein